MEIKGFLAPSQVVIDLRASDKARWLDELARGAAPHPVQIPRRYRARCRSARSAGRPERVAAWRSHTRGCRASTSLPDCSTWSLINPRNRPSAQISGTDQLPLRSPRLEPGAPAGTL